MSSPSTWQKRALTTHVQAPRLKAISWRRLFGRGRAPARFSTERIGHESAADGGIQASPVPPVRKKCVNVRSIFKISGENAEIADCVADGAVRRELLSTSNSLITSENTGDFRDFDRLRACLQPKKLCLLSCFSLNSLLIGSGILKREQGIFLPY